MNLIRRRILYITFIIVFLAMAPLLLMYTNGYRYDFKKGVVIKTGILILESNPQKVNVYINNELKYTKTPIDRASLLPGLYEIKITKNGYYPWTKKLKIESNLTTFAQDVILFKKSTSVKIINGNFNDFTISKDNAKIITLWQDEATAEIWEYKLKEQSSNLLLRNSLNNSEIKLGEWSKNNKNLIFNNYGKTEQKNNYFIIQFKESFWSNEDEIKTIKLNELISDPIINIKWDDNDDNVAYVNTKDSLYRINLMDQIIKEISKDKISDFIIYDKILYFNTELFCLIEIDKNQINTQNSIIDDCIYHPAKEKDYQLISSPQGLITLVSENSKNSLVIDLNNKNKIFQIQTEEIKWDSASNKMLYYNDIEIATFSPSHQHPYKNEIIGRYSQEIKKVLWYPSHHHLIILFNDNLKIIELDTRDKRNVVSLNSFTNLKNIYIDEKGKNIYVVGSKDGESGIWQINIF
ncbi:MAG: PEGA domain-containing protein [bacterium]